MPTQRMAQLPTQAQCLTVWICSQRSARSVQRQSGNHQTLCPHICGETEIAHTPDVIFWASVYKAICGIKDAPEAIVSKAKAWLHEHGMSPNLAG